jgi:hypothetical protein
VAKDYAIIFLVRTCFCELFCDMQQIITTFLTVCNHMLHYFCYLTYFWGDVFLICKVFFTLFFIHTIFLHIFLLHEPCFCVFIFKQLRNKRPQLCAVSRF